MQIPDHIREGLELLEKHQKENTDKKNTVLNDIYSVIEKAGYSYDEADKVLDDVKEAIRLSSKVQPNKAQYETWSDGKVIVTPEA